MSRVGLWAGPIAAPLAWFATLEAGYALAPWACATGRLGALHVVDLAGLLLVLAAGALSWRAWAREPRAASVPPDTTRRFLAGTGVLASALFALVLVATEVGALVLGTCG